MSYSLVSIRPLVEKLWPRHFRHGRKQSCFQFQAKNFKGPSFQGSDPRSFTSWQPRLANTPWLVVQGQPCILRHDILLRLPVHIHTAASPPDGLFHLPLMLMFRPCFPSSSLSLAPASLQGRGCSSPGFPLALHSLHSQSMSVPSPGALALLVEAAVFPPITSHSRLVLLLSTRDIRRWGRFIPPKPPLFFAGWALTSWPAARRTIYRCHIGPSALGQVNRCAAFIHLTPPRIEPQARTHSWDTRRHTRISSSP